jgi:hypothetical protein
MSKHRIVCTEQEPVYAPTTHAHIVAVGTGTNPAKADARWTLAQVIEAIDRGEVFYTVGPTSGKVALVVVVGCRHCGRRIIRSAPDAVKDNNLDSLRRCQWAS